MLKPPKPMLAKAVDALPISQDWTMEKKYDGWRCLATINNSEVRLTTRTGKAITSLPYIEEELADLPDGTVLDGEIVNLDGSEEWNKTQEVCSRNRVHDITHDTPLTFVVFDLLYVNGESRMEQTLAVRRELFGYYLDERDRDNIQIAEHFPCKQSTLAEFLLMGYEGVVCKRITAPYRPGNRGVWVKVKGIKEMDVICTGFYPPEEGSKHDGVRVGGLEFEYELKGQTIKGRCAGKIDDKTRGEWYDKPQDFIGKYFEVEHYGINKTGALRMPQFRRFRDEADKPTPKPKTIPKKEVTKIEN
jgi:bifunctional non-homologous end joining protein LigD